MKRTLIALLCLISPFTLFAQLNRGYGQLEKGEFGEAKTNFNKNRNGSKPGSKDIMEAYFGLFSYYSTEANPENNPDKAWLYLDSTSNNFKEDFKVKYKPYEAAKMNKIQIDTLKAQMEKRAYSKALAANTVPNWKQFIDFYTKSNNAGLLKKAERGLHQKAFEDYAKKNDLAGLESFVVEYKNATQVDSALALIDGLRWKNTLTTNTRDAYIDFLKKYPRNKQAPIAADTLSAVDFRAVSHATTAAAFKAYLAAYPDSKFKAAAMSRICLISYDSVVTANKEAGYIGFVKEYPGCPQVGVVKDKLERMECEKCLAAPTKECLSLVMKNCGSDNAIALRVNAALMAMVDQNKDKIDCEKCLASPTRACLIALFKNCGSDSSLVKRANDVFLAVVKKEELNDAAKAATQVPIVKSAPVAVPATVEAKVDTAAKAVSPAEKKDAPEVTKSEKQPGEKPKDN